jgi:hypothetical protein
MSKSNWTFKPTAVRRAFRIIEEMGFTPSGVQFGNGTFTVLIGGNDRVASQCHLSSSNPATNGTRCDAPAEEASEIRSRLHRCAG